MHLLGAAIVPTTAVELWAAGRTRVGRHRVVDCLPGLQRPGIHESVPVPTTFIMIHHKIASSLIVLLPCVMLPAQVERPARPPAAEATDAQRATRNQAVVEGDAILANWLLVGSNSEVSIARLAQEKALSSEVKLFANKMVEEHGQFARRLEPFAGAPAKDAKQVHGSEASGHKSGKGNDDNGEKRKPADAGGARSTAPSGAFDHLALIRDLGEKCLASQTRMLRDRSGSEFDLAFMRMQVAAHSEAVVMSEVFARHASSSLRPTLEQGHETLQAHLEQAKALCRQLEKADTAKIGSDNR